MKFVQKEFSHTYEEKKSKFMAFLVPYEDFDKLMDRLRKEHPKARHFVYAYRYLNEYEQVVENCSDDGEPKGTSGKPSLAVLAGNDMVNTAVIIVRYFGGIKLGTGGLVRAYSSAVNLVINSAELYEYKKLVEASVELDYSILSKIEYLLNSLDIRIIEKIFDTKVKIIFKATDEQMNLLNNKLPREVNVNNK